MKGKKRRTALIAVLAAFSIVALIGAGCGGGDDDTDTVAEEPAPATDSGAAELRADLTHLLTEHVELAGITVVQGAGNGLDSGEFEAAAGALDQNSQDLAGAIGSVYGDDAGDQFLELWRAHIDMFVDYTEGVATGDEQQARGAERDLDGYREDFGAFLEAANPSLTKDAVAEELRPHVNSLTKAIDSVVEGSPDAFGDLQQAASHMPTTASVLAGAIAEQNPDQFDGAADSGASELRSTLTYLLDQHVYAAAIAINTGIGSGLDSGEFEAAAGALDQNSQDLAGAIGSVYGDDAGDQFLELWRAHIDMFVDYTEGVATGDEQQARGAERDLDGYREDFGAFLEAANPSLTKDAVAEELEPHVESVITVIDSAVEGDPSLFEELRVAAGHMPGTANVLAGAIATQFPERFDG